jgi:hypothetical protein
MNNETVNYAFLAGFLESSLKGMADDYHFLKMDSYLERRAHVDKMIARANELARQHAEKYAAA